MPSIFISYRRDDAGGHALHLYEELAQRYGKDSVFMDLSTIGGGERWADRIDQAIAQSDAFVALIGARWLEVRDSAGNRRLDDPDDVVRREIAAGLALDAPTIPVLLDGARMPDAESLPADIADLAGRNAVELTSKRWDYDLRALLRLLPASPRLWLLRAAAGLAAMVVVAVAVWLFLRARADPVMTGIFNAAVVDFSALEAAGSGAEEGALTAAGPEGTWIADWVYGELERSQQELETEQNLAGVVELARLARRPAARTRAKLDDALAEIADAVNATIVVHGVLELQELPYRFVPSLYLTREFKGGEELTGASAFGSPVHLAMPFDDSPAGTVNRLALSDALRGRMKALHRFTLGLGFLQAGRPDRALELFDQADEVGGWVEGKEILHLFRGSALYLLDRIPEAGEAYEEALALDPGYGRALMGMGNLFLDRGRVDRAVGLYRQAVEAERDASTSNLGAKARFNLGLALATASREQGEACDSPEAAGALQAVVESGSQDPESDVLRELAFKARHQLGLLELSCGDSLSDSGAMAAYSEAVRHLEAAVALAEPRRLDDGTGRIEQRPWQKGRWPSWELLGYSQMRLAELGDEAHRDEALASFETVTGRFEANAGEVPAALAADVWALRARALQPSDPERAAEARARSEEIRRTAASQE